MGRTPIGGALIYHPKRTNSVDRRNMFRIKCHYKKIFLLQKKCHFRIPMQLFSLKLI